MSEIMTKKGYTVDGSMMLPDGRACGECVHWERCKALIYTLEPDNDHCDFAPSRFRRSKAPHE